MTNATIQDPSRDTLNRGPYLVSLVKLIDRLDKGVIAIDGEWGAGKTWAGQSLKNMLDEQGGGKTIWLDVFEADWSDDPAVSLIATMAAQLEPEKAKTFLEKAAPVLTAILPLATKSLVKSALNYLGADEDITKDIVQVGQSQTEKYIKKHLEAASEKQKNLAQLKDLLNQTVKENAGKLVIFVDELDRCSPGYAVRFLERMKHLFDLDGVVYILLWNREQVAKTVEVFYGAGANGQMFLDKFIDYPLHIPISHNNSRNRPPLADFIDAITPMVDGKERGATEQTLINEHVLFLAGIAQILGLTARETKRLAAWWVMSPNRQYPVLEIWLLGLKAKHPDKFAGIRGGDPTAHAKAHKLLTGAQSQVEANSREVLALIELHARTVDNTLDQFTPDLKPLLTGNLGNLSNAVSAAIRRLEFDFG